MLILHILLVPFDGQTMNFRVKIFIGGKTDGSVILSKDNNCRLQLRFFKYIPAGNFMGTPTVISCTTGSKCPLNLIL